MDKPKNKYTNMILEGPNCCGGSGNFYEPETTSKTMNDFKNLKVNTTKDIKILGTGCAKCKTLEKLTLQAVEELNLDARVIKVEDIVEIMQYGVMSTPGLVIDEKVVLSGKLPSLKELKELLT